MRCNWLSTTLLVTLCLALAHACAQAAVTATPAATDSQAARPTEVITIGVLEQAHNTAQHYTVNELRSVLLTLRPAAILVELFSEDLNADGTVKENSLKDAYNPAIAVANDVATALGIRQIAFERADRNEHWQQTGYWQSQQRMNSEASKWAETLDADSLDGKLFTLLKNANASQEAVHAHGSAEVVNSEAYDRVIRNKHLLAQIIFARMAELHRYPEAEDDGRVFWDDWRDRNRIMADNIARIAADFPGKRLVVTTGGEHRYMLRDLLADRPGIVLREFWEVLP